MEQNLSESLPDAIKEMAFEDLGHSAEVQDLNSYFDLVTDIYSTLYKSDCHC